MNSILPQAIGFKFIVFFPLIAVGLCASAEAQSDLVQKRAEMISLEIYGNGLMNTNHLVELVDSNPKETFSLLTKTLYDQENYLCHLLAKRGRVVCLHHLIAGMEVADRTQLVMRLNDSYYEGLLVQHRVVWSAYSPYWIRQYERLGFDFSIPEKSRKGLASVKDAVVVRWGEESDAYQYFFNLQENGSNKSGNDS